MVLKSFFNKWIPQMIYLQHFVKSYLISNIEFECSCSALFRIYREVTNSE